ncbi:MAG: hypothetical protein PHX64_00975 [Candidatus Omnitrophica bacterium]|nr:hypothetical protein [Candidatus Omnitrophota bacterium]MDD5310311.1 hypothetical protein [Candidatus Omnitrophota bacterium]MDD5545856.1 hypothetical protein [Candidatus Omnitrophota bacterium]
MRVAYKKAVLILAVAVAVINMSGCETLKKKFTRKQSPKKVTPVLQPQNYKGIYPNAVLYSNHYNYWRTWTEDLMDCLDNQGSNKRERLAAARAVEDLQRMQDLLTGAKKEELAKYIKFYQGVQKKVDFGQPGKVEASSIRSDLESRRRVIMRKFEPSEVKAFILKEEEPIKPIQITEQTLPKK